eukprot:gene4641-9209_t
MVSTFDGILEDALDAFKDNAHRKVLDFFENSGDSQDHIENFRNVWSKVYIESQAFGRKERPENNAFRHHFLDEISHTYNDSIKLHKILQHLNQTLTQEDSNSSTEVDNDNDNTRLCNYLTAIDDLQQIKNNMTKISHENMKLTHRNIAHKSHTANNEHESNAVAELISYRRQLRNAKIIWSTTTKPYKHSHSNKSPLSHGTGTRSGTGSEYIPLDPHPHGYPDVLLGDIQTKGEVKLLRHGYVL